MTTRTYSAVMDHTGDAPFRVWAQQLSDELVAAGMVRVADTGTINFTTATRPAINTSGGFEIMRFADALQGTAPIFFKIEYGSSTTVTNPQIWITVGTGSNGSGTITGQATTRRECLVAGAPTSTVISYPTYICGTAGHLGCAFKLGSQSSGLGAGFFAIVRTADATGAHTATGFVLYTAHTTASAILRSQSVRTAATAASYSVTDTFCIVPQLPITSVNGSDYQAFAHFAVSPLVWTVPTMATVLLSEFPGNTTFSVAMVGSTARNMLSLGQVGLYGTLIGAAGGGGAATSYGLAMVWE